MEWVRVFSFCDAQPAVRDQFRLFLEARGQQFRVESIEVPGEPLPPAVEGGEPIPRSETVFDIPFEPGVPQGEETQEQANARAGGDVANALRDAWRAHQK